MLQRKNDAVGKITETECNGGGPQLTNLKMKNS